MLPVLWNTFFFLLPVLTRAANDWSTPCAGSCAYETGDGTTTAWGSILIDGELEAISDISTAAGWSIMDCNSTSQDAQEIRLICHDPDAGCDHLFQGGAADTIVRLPEECADAPFARVVNVTTSTNQTLTRDIAKRVATRRRRRSSPPEVMVVIIDYNFTLLPASRGTISLTALATTNPLQKPLTSTQNLRRALGYEDDGSLNTRSRGSARELVEREVRRRDLFANFIGGNQIPPGVNAATGATNTSSNITNHLGSTEAWTQQWNKQYNIFNIQGSYPVMNFDVACPQNGNIPAFQASADINADVNIQATMTVGFIVSGTILPPAINQAAFTSALDGGSQVVFNISAIAQGSFDTGLIPFYSDGVPGMSIPGILEIGPTFSINGEATGNISVCTNSIVSASYQFPGISMVFPQDQGPSNGTASQTTDQTPLHLSIGGSTTLSGSVTAHIIPRVDLGVSLLLGAASASVFLELDGYGALDMSLTLDEPLSTSVPSNTSTPANLEAADTSTTSPENIPSTTSSDTSSSSSSPTDTPTISPTPTSVTNTTTVSPTSNSSSVSAANDFALPPVLHDASPSETPSATCAGSRPRHRQQPARRDLAIRHQARDASDQYNGCVGMSMGVKIVVGAQGQLMPFWHDSISWDLFGQEWPLFDKCFKSSTKRSLPSYHHGPIIPSHKPALARRDLISSLVCPIVEDALANAITASNQLV